MKRSKAAGKPFYTYLPYTQVHIPPIPDPEFAQSTKRGNFADLLAQIDAFTGRILDTLDELGVADDTIVVWASDNGADTTYRMPAMDPDPAGGQWSGFSGPWRGGYFTSLEGSNRAPCIIRWPGTCARRQGEQRAGPSRGPVPDAPACAAAATVPSDRQIDGMDMRDFLLGDAEESGRDVVLCIQGNRLQAIKWHQWKASLFEQDGFYSTWTAYNMPHVLQPGMGSARGAPGRLPARLDRPSDGGRGGRLPADAGHGTADQARYARSVPAAQAGRDATRGAPPDRRHHPVRDVTRTFARDAARAQPRHWSLGRLGTWSEPVADVTGSARLQGGDRTWTRFSSSSSASG